MKVVSVRNDGRIAWLEVDNVRKGRLYRQYDWDRDQNVVLDRIEPITAVIDPIVTQYLIPQRRAYRSKRGINNQ